MDDHQETPNLVEAISLMTEELKCHDDKSGKAKAKDPDTFDGSDTGKIDSFLLLCNLYFHNNLSYADDKAKVTFALTYLCGTCYIFFPFTSLLHFLSISHTTYSAITHT